MFTPDWTWRILHPCINLTSAQSGDRSTLKNKSTTNSLITLPQLPGQIGCFSSSSSSSSSFVTVVAGPKLTLRKVPSSIPKSQHMIVSQQSTAFCINISSCGGSDKHASRTWVNVTHKGWRMLQSSCAFEWMCCSNGRWKVVCFVNWEGMNVLRYSVKQDKWTVFSC